MPRPMTNYDTVKRSMVSNLSASDRGRLDFIWGKITCPFKDAAQKAEWLQGWRNERDGVAKS